MRPSSPSINAFRNQPGFDRPRVGPSKAREELPRVDLWEILSKIVGGHQLKRGELTLLSRYWDYDGEEKTVEEEAPTFLVPGEWVDLRVAGRVGKRRHPKPNTSRDTIALIPRDPRRLGNLVTGFDVMWIKNGTLQRLAGWIRNARSGLAQYCGSGLDIGTENTALSTVQKVLPLAGNRSGQRVKINVSSLSGRYFDDLITR